MLTYNLLIIIINIIITSAIIIIVVANLVKDKKIIRIIYCIYYQRIETKHAKSDDLLIINRH